MGGRQGAGELYLGRGIDLLGYASGGDERADSAGARVTTTILFTGGTAASLTGS